MKKPKVKKNVSQLKNENTGEDPVFSTKTWHLAQTEVEDKLSNFELLLWRLFYSFLRWQEDCQSCVSDDDVTAHEIALMHLIRIRERPKSLYEIARVMNRDDMPNLQYSLKKLLKLNIIKKSKKSAQKTIFYEIAERGIRITDKYSAIRRDILKKRLANFKDQDWEQISEILAEYKSMYDEASRVASLLRTDENILK